VVARASTSGSTSNQTAARASPARTTGAPEKRLLAATLRALDLLIASACLLVSAVPLLLLCALIRLESPGAAVFRQRRLGRARRTFTMHKLRTMRKDADPEVHRRYVEELIGDSGGPHVNGRRSLYKLAADDRVTRVGRMLRRASLDELPQLLDVVRGHMSVVGPRPVTAYEAELYPPTYERRFQVKPGLTGLWQVSGRNERTYREMVALDLAWVERRSLKLYLEIVARTPWAVIRGRGAA
jgi:lipopolysaccharide/colanic/teichoic acid biosynthesis glycosyltransferase